MRRPLNWVVVAISLLVLLANGVVLPPNPTAYAPVTSDSAGFFSYVKEDGTEIFLPVPRSAVLPPLSFEDVHATSGFVDPADPKTAVYTWRSPLLTADRSDVR